MSDRRIVLSICVPTYNRADALVPRVKAWLALDCRDFEIVVLGNASPNGSRLRRRNAIVPHLHCRPIRPTADFYDGA